MVTKDSIKAHSEAVFDEVVKHRRHLHAYPELSYQEYRTAEYLEGILQEWQIPFERKAKTGIVALIKGKNPDKKCVALRADTDALPIMEANEIPYKSRNKGVMHACGHDVHTSSMLGVTQILNKLKDQFEGTFKVIFQPAEEQTPGGASIMINEGVLENPEPRVIFGQHVMPELETGTVGFKSGKFMASSDEIRITVKGKGGHAAMPYKLVDPVLIASHIVVSLQQIISRNADPNIPSVLSFGVIEGKGANNVIPETVYLEGTFRTFDETWRAEALDKIRNMACGIAESMAGSCEVDIQHGYPALYNDEDLTAKSVEYAEEYLGKANVKQLGLRPTAEDFAYYSRHMPACFYRLGVANSRKGIESALHTSTFDIDEEALRTGVGLMVFIALKVMSEA